MLGEPTPLVKAKARSGEILRAVGDPQLDVEGYERARDERYARREGFY